MASSSVGSDVFALLSLLVISLLVLLLLRYYLPLRSTPAYLLVPVFLALALPSSIILLVPIDLASSSGTDDSGARGIWLPERVMLVAWRIAYWLTFVLTWVVLPLLGEYSDSGYREPRDRFIYSLRSNGRYQLMVLGTGTAAAVYFFLQSGFHANTFKGLVMALAYTWGLILAIYLMGHGLVALPRRLFRNASVSGRLRRLHTQAPKVHDKMEEAMEELDQVETLVMQLRQRRSGTSKDMQDWIEELAETSSMPESRPTAVPTRTPAKGIPAVVTERYIADVARKLKRARHKKARFVNEWDILVQQASDLQTILDSANSKRLDFGRPQPGSHSLLSHFTILTPYTRYHFYTNVLPALRLVLGGLFSLASVALIWSEIIHPVFPKLSLVGLSVVHHPSSSRGQVGFAGQVIAALWLLYMCAAALFSVTEVRVWGNRALVRRQTYAESACWYALQVAKLTVPLSFNFITMMPRDVFLSTTFYGFLGRLIDLTPLGGGISNYFPVFILIPVCAAFFNLYGRIKNVIGFGVLDDESEENETGFGLGGAREGRALIERELQHNADPAHVGLSSSLRASAVHSLEPDGPGISTPPSRSSRDLPSRSVPAPVGSSRAIANRRRELENEEDSGDRYFFQDFGERLRNTFDVAERPQWIRDIGEGIKVPAWMKGDDRDRGRGESNFGRWFGGRPREGGVRLG